MIRGNPEFIKNLKLEFSKTRFIIPLLLLCLAVWIGWSGGNATYEPWNAQYSEEQRRAQSLNGWLFGFGFLFTIIWGTFLASSSLLEEIKLKTWDFVRMSSLSPLKILVGKIFGATSVVWIITLLGTVPCLIYVGAAMIPGNGVIRPETLTLTIFILSLFFWTILSYSLSILIGLMTDEKLSRNGPFGNTMLIFMMGMTIGGFITAAYSPFHNVERYGQIQTMVQQPNAKPIPLPPNAVVVEPDFSYMRLPDVTHWYGYDIYTLDAAMILLAFFGTWAFVGAWRALRRSLQYRDAPWVWIAFLMTSCFFLNGFPLGVTDMPRLQQTLCWPIITGVVTMFFACITEAGDIIRYRAFAQKLKTESWSEAFRLMPLWILSFATFVVSIVLSVVIVSQSVAALLLCASLIGFVTRDLLVFHAISWTPNVRRPLVGMAVYMAVFYVFLPQLADTAGAHNGYLFFPLVREAPGLTYWIMLAVELAVASIFFTKRWDKAFDPAVTSAG